LLVDRGEMPGIPEEQRAEIAASMQRYVRTRVTRL
jgi:hypothetical protein